MSIDSRDGKVLDKKWVEENYHGEPELIIPEGFIGIGRNAFKPDPFHDYMTNNLKKIILSNGILEIEKGAFSECEGLQEVIMPDTVRIIEDSAFSECGKLRNIRFSNNLYKIEKFVFDGCSSLKNIQLPDSLCLLGNSAFEDCDSLETVRLSQNLIAIPYQAFVNCCNLAHIDIPDSVKRIGSEAFYGCEKLKVIDLQNVEDLREGAFGFCKALESVYLGEPLEKISRNCFNSCYSLESISLPNSLRQIDDKAFCDCHSLETIHLPDSIEEIGDRVFKGCTSLSQVNIPKNLIELGSDTFENAPVKDDLPFVMQGNTILKVYASDVVIPEGVTEIQDNAFGDYHQYISFPASLEKFNGCIINADYINIEGDLSTFHQAAFLFCTIIEFKINEGVTPIKLNLQNDWLETDAERAVVNFYKTPTYENFCLINQTDYKIALAISFGMNEDAKYEDFRKYLRRVGDRAVIKMIDDQNYDALDFYTKNRLITFKACEAGIQHAIHVEDNTMFIFLTEYKNMIGGYKKNNLKQFEL